MKFCVWKHCSNVTMKTTNSFIALYDKKTKAFCPSQETHFSSKYMWKYGTRLKICMANLFKRHVKFTGGFRWKKFVLFYTISSILSTSIQLPVYLSAQISLHFDVIEYEWRRFWEFFIGEKAMLSVISNPYVVGKNTEYLHKLLLMSHES